MAVQVATAAARLVVTKILPASSIACPSMDTVEQPLKPNQQNQRMKTPNAPNVRLWPGIAWGFPSRLYLPRRGPKIHAPIRAATPPARCTAAEPAKSWEPHLCKPAAAPDPVAGNRIDHQTDDEAVNAVCGKFCPFCHGAGHDGGRCRQNTVWKIRNAKGNAIRQHGSAVVCLTGQTADSPHQRTGAAEHQTKPHPARKPVFRCRSPSGFS